MPRIYRPQLLLALFALIVCTGTVQAYTPVLVASPTTTINLSCTASGANSANVTLTKTTAAAYPITVTAPSVGGVSATFAGGISTLDTTHTSLTVTLAMATGCTGASATEGAAVTFQFKVGANNDATASVATWPNAQLGTSLAVYPVPLVLGCNTATGPAPAQTLTVKPLTALTSTQTISVTVPAPAGVTVTPSTSPQVLNASTNVTQNYSFAYSSCATVTGATVPAIQFKTGTSTLLVDQTVNATTNLVATASGLQISPPTMTLYCGKNQNGPTAAVSPGSPQTLWVSYTPPGGMSFTVNSSPAIPQWLSVSSGFTAISTQLPLVFTPTAQCNAWTNSTPAGTSTTTTVNLQDTSTPGKNVTVKLVLQDYSPLTVSTVGNVPNLITYVKNSGAPGHVDINVASQSPIFFSVDTTSLPTWLTVDQANGTTPKQLRLSSSSFADTLAPGTYNGTLRLRVSTLGDYLYPVNLLITNAPPKLQITNISSIPAGTPGQNSLLTTWSQGSVLPTMSITAQSTDSPVSYSITTSGTLFPKGTTPISPSLLQGLAYSFGTVIPINPDSGPFAAAQPNDVLTGNVTITWGSPAATTVVTFNVKVVSASATLASVSPASEPVSTVATTYPIVLSGTGFIGGDITTRTKVGIASNSVMGVANVIADANIQVTSVSSSTIYVTVNVPATGIGPNFTFAQAGTILLGVCNPGVCPVATGIVSLTVGTVPTIQSVTSASSFQQLNGANSSSNMQTTAPYDMLSIFGANFCPSCTSATILQGKPDAVLLSYPLALQAPDGINSLSVTFQATSGSPPAVLGTAPLLFASNSQINLLVPGGLSTGAVDVVVNFGSTSSAPYHMTVANANPGIFTIGADGQGSGAILNTSYALVSATAPAAMRKINASDSVSIYMTGLGVPDSAASNASAGTLSGAVWGTDCVKAIGNQASGAYSYYLGQQIGTNGGTPTGTLDGVVLPSSLLNTDRMVPCFVQADIVSPDGGTTPPEFSVSIGGQNAPIGFAGWIGDSIAGLYQVNVTLPVNSVGAGPFTDIAGVSHATLTAPVQLPITVTGQGRTSQAGVSLWVAPRLSLTAPTNLFGLLNTAWPTSNNSNLVVPADGTSSFHFAVTTGTLPPGLVLDPASGAITGTPTAIGQYTVTVTVTDSAVPPVTGTVSFTLASGVNLAFNPSGPFTYAFGTQRVVHVTANPGGATPYAFSLTGNPAGITIATTGTNGNTADVTIAATVLAGAYSNLTVVATDADGVTSKVAMPVTITLNVTGVPSTMTALTSGTVANLTVTGATANGTLVWSMDPSSPGGFSVDQTGQVTVDNSVGAGGSPYAVKVNVVDSAGTRPGTSTAYGAGSITLSVVVQ